MKTQNPAPTQPIVTPTVSSETLDGLRQMGRELETDPAFLRAMHRRLRTLLDGSAAKHDH